MGTDRPTFITNATNWNASTPLSNQTLSWGKLPLDNESGWTGFSLIVDDVERVSGNATSYSLASLAPSLPHFFRIAVRSLLVLRAELT